MSFQQIPHTAHSSMPMQVLAALQTWVRREIVDDDPWDQSTLFPNCDQNTQVTKPDSDKANL